MKFLKQFFNSCTDKISVTLHKAWLQKLGFAIAIIIGSTFVSKAIIDKDIRLLVCATIVFILAVCSLKIKLGVFAMLIYLPFMALLRRWIYSYDPYIGLDPILIIVSVITLFMFGYIFMFYGEDLMRQTKNNKLLKYMTFFILLLFLQVANPLQGGLTVGFSGIMYWIIPALWFYFAFFISRDDIKIILNSIVIIGVIAAIYGLKQTYFGLFPFESYWVKYGGFTSLSVHGFIKSFSIFTNPQEFSLYLLIASGIVFMRLLQPSLSYPLLVSAFSIIMWGNFMTSTRGSIFYFLFLIMVLISVKLQSLKKTLLCWIVFVLIVSKGISYITPFSHSAGSAQTAHISHLTKGVADPMEEASFQIRIEMIKWTFIELLSTPFGRGIGAGTLGVSKFGGQGIAGAEIFQLAIIGTCGIPGLILYLLLMYQIIKQSMFLIRKEPKTYLIPGTLAIWFGIALDTRLYSIGPIFWLLWGWIAKESGNYKANSEET